MAIATTVSSIYEELGVTLVINARGNNTVLGGSTPSPRVKAAIERAERYFVDMEQLLACSGEIVAGLLGAEAAYVTPGAAAAMALGTAACITGDDVELMGRLPDTGLKNKVVIQRAHRHIRSGPDDRRDEAGRGRRRQWHHRRAARRGARPGRRQRALPRPPGGTTRHLVTCRGARDRPRQGSSRAGRRGQPGLPPTGSRATRRWAPTWSASGRSTSVARIHLGSCAARRHWSTRPRSRASSASTWRPTARRSAAR